MKTTGLSDYNYLMKKKMCFLLENLKFVLYKKMSKDILK